MSAGHLVTFGGVKPGAFRSIQAETLYSNKGKLGNLKCIVINTFTKYYSKKFYFMNI